MYRPIDGTGSGLGAAAVEGEAASDHTIRDLEPADDLPGGEPACPAPVSAHPT